MVTGSAANVQKRLARCEFQQVYHQLILCRSGIFAKIRLVPFIVPLCDLLVKVYLHNHLNVGNDPTTKIKPQHKQIHTRVEAKSRTDRPLHLTCSGEFRASAGLRGFLRTPSAENGKDPFWIFRFAGRTFEVGAVLRNPLQDLELVVTASTFVLVYGHGPGPPSKGLSTRFSLPRA